MKTDLTSVRRKNRELTDENAIRKFLHESAYGVLGTVSGDQPYVHSNLFIYDEKVHAVFFHTIKNGRLQSVIEQNPKACFTVFSMGRLLPGPRAIDFSVEYLSVVIFGHIEIVTNRDTIMNVFQKYFEKYFSNLTPRDYTPFTFEDAQKTTVYRITISEWSAKKHREPDDFAGAVNFPTAKY